MAKSALPQESCEQCRRVILGKMIACVFEDRVLCLPCDKAARGEARRRQVAADRVARAAAKAESARGRPMPRENADNAPYIHYTGPAQMDKGIQSLKGLLLGVAADKVITDDEVDALRSWVEDHRLFDATHPFNELVPKMNEVLADGVVELEEVEDVLWLLSRLGGDHYDRVTADMQELHGLLAGVTADGVVTMDELDAVLAWVGQRGHLATVWPYDEVVALVTQVKQDGQVDEVERRQLMAFFSEFASRAGHRAVDLPLNEVGTPITGLCAVRPEVRFEGRAFSFTGSSARATRKGLAEVVEARGGKFSANLTKGTDYLVIGGDGNPCWAYSCYGRKVEQAIKLRKQGGRVLLVHEDDFWDAKR